jgi:hypothetical protein
MITLSVIKKKTLALLLPAVLLVSGCDIASSYRPAYQKTIRDYSGSSDYKKRVGILALSNTTVFTSDQVSKPFMSAFLASMASVASNGVLVLPGKSETTSFLWTSPRMPSGDIDAFALAELARQAGMNAVAGPLLMNIRVRTHKTGFWLFKDVVYSLQIQTAATLYDAFTGSRLALKILTDEVEIEENQANIIEEGQEVEVDELVDVAKEMGESLGEAMGEAVNDSKWVASVVASNNGVCVIAAGSKVGVDVGDRFAVLDGSRVITGLDGQRYIVPGPKIGEITVSRVTPKQSFGAPDSGELPPVGSILVPK